MVQNNGDELLKPIAATDRKTSARAGEVAAAASVPPRRPEGQPPAAAVWRSLCPATSPSHRHDLADEFLDLARDVNAALIVIGLRHRTQVGKFITGSHALRILIQADRPVRAVNADGAGQ